MVNLSQVDCYYDETVVIRKRGKLLVPKVTCTTYILSEYVLRLASLIFALTFRTSLEKWYSIY